MRRHFARLPDAEKQAAYTQAALQANTLPVITEKDFWVCWLLGRIYAMPTLGAHCVFKGGTSLSKVFGIIQRFSEDIDLGILPATFGWKESDLDDAPTPTQRRKRMDRLMAECADFVRESFQPQLEASVSSMLGPGSGGSNWLVYTEDPAAQFASAWANYQSATPGTLHLLPPDSRIEELRRDYAAMKPMFIGEPEEFDQMLATIHHAEVTLNKR